MTADRARLRVFRALDDRGGCEAFFAAHAASLDHHKMYGLTSLDPRWFGNPLAYALLLETPAGEPLAGVRIQLAGHRGEPLPSELVVRHDGVRDYVRQRLVTGIGELCGAWVAPGQSKTGVFALIACAGVALTAPLGVRIALASCATYTLSMLIDLGLRVERRLGDDGTFYYPTPDNLSFFMVLPDTGDLGHALPACRRSILDLRARPRQRRTIDVRGGRMEVDIDLRLTAMSRHSVSPDVSAVG